MSEPSIEQLPIISMWRPWANWVALGWKTIESRKNNRLKSLSGRRVGIHASLKWDKNWMRDAERFLTPNQIALTSQFLNIGGAVICTVFAEQHRQLSAPDSLRALIDCQNTLRYGLLLRDVESIEPIPMKGHRGIWYSSLLVNVDAESSQ